MDGAVHACMLLCFGNPAQDSSKYSSKANVTNVPVQVCQTQRLGTAPFNGLCISHGLRQRARQASDLRLAYFNVGFSPAECSITTRIFSLAMTQEYIFVSP